jgi:hypothetical protein
MNSLFHPAVDVKSATFAVKHSIETEDHEVSGEPVLVYRADDCVLEDLSPFVKCAVMPAFCRWVKSSGFESLAYYAIKESFWVADLKRCCDLFGVRTLITHPKIKQLLPWAEKMHGDIYFLNPNHYAINFAVTRKILHERDGERGLMLPMGVNVPAFVELQTELFRRNPLPDAATYVVPAGSGTACACIARAVKSERCKIYAIAHRPAESVRRTIEENNGRDVRLEVIEHKHAPAHEDALWPISKSWELTAYAWLQSTILTLRQPICFVNLGR